MHPGISKNWFCISLLAMVILAPFVFSLGEIDAGVSVTSEPSAPAPSPQPAPAPSVETTSPATTVVATATTTTTTTQTDIGLSLTVTETVLPSAPASVYIEPTASTGSTIPEEPSSIASNPSETWQNGTVELGLDCAIGTIVGNVGCGSAVVIDTYPTGSEPDAIAIASNGEILVANEGSSQLQEIAGTGTVMQSIPTDSTPVAIAVDAQGNVWVADEGSNELQEFSPSGELITTIATDSEPDAIAIDSSGNIWVEDLGSNELQEFSPTGQLEATVSTGVQPDGIAIDASGNVWVVNGGSNTLEEISSSGQVLLTLPTGNHPDAVEIGLNGNIWVANGASNTVEEFSSSGSVLETVQVGNNPVAIGIGIDGNIWVVDEGSNEVQEISPEGMVLATVSTGLQPDAITVDAQGDIFVADKGSNEIQEIAVASVVYRTGENGSGGMQWSSWQPVRKNVEISEDGKWDVQYYAVSSQGKTSTMEDLSVLVDQTPPQVSSFAANFSGTDIVVQADATDNLSGVKKFWYKLDGDSTNSENWIDPNNTYTFSNVPPGSHHTHVIAEDFAGNFSAPQSALVTLSSSGTKGSSLSGMKVIDLRVWLIVVIAIIALAIGFHYQKHINNPVN